MFKTLKWDTVKVDVDFVGWNCNTIGSAHPSAGCVGGIFLLELIDSKGARGYPPSWIALFFSILALCSCQKIPQECFVKNGQSDYTKSLKLIKFMGGKKERVLKNQLFKKSIFKDRKLTKQVFEREEGILYNL